MILSDEPIKEAGEDVLGRARLATVIADEIRNFDASPGVVIGILGPWGSGKTSLINLIRNELNGPPWIRSIVFNPWMFSGSDQLVDRFFAEMAVQLKEGPGGFSKLAGALEDYAEVIAPLQFIPVVGWLGSAGKAFKELRAKRRGGIERERDRVTRELQSLDSPIVVVIDDIDRLRTDEIRDIFKLVRLTASFPNLIYMVAFDRARVESALEEDGLPGRDYLEKIIQVPYDIPAIPDVAIRDQVREALIRTLDGIENAGPLSSSRWPDVFEEVIRPLIRNMRDVRRYSASIRGTVRSLEGAVELVDVLALEAIRVFLPDVFATIMTGLEALTTPSSGASMFDDVRDARSRPMIETLLEAGGDRRDVVRAMIERLFPVAARYLERGYAIADSASTYLRERRVAHPEVFGYYLERVAGRRLQAFWIAEQVVSISSDEEALIAFFRARDPSEWEEIIRALASYESDFPLEAALPASVVLLNLVHDIPERPRSAFDLGARFAVTGVVLRILKRLSDAAHIEKTVRAALPRIATLREKLALLNLVGQDPDLGYQLISPEASQELEAGLRAEIRAAPPQTLAQEQEIMWLLAWTKKSSTLSEPPMDLRPDPILSGALLKEAVAEVHSQTFGTRHVRVEKRFQLESLVDLVGGEDKVGQMVEKCRAQGGDSALSEAIDLADKYLSGWRPERY